jgi:hypothetical protein
MSAFSKEFHINNLANLLPGWDKLISDDLVREIERDISETAQTIPEMRLFLAVKGYRQLMEILTRESDGKTGAGALKAMTLAARRYAKERPGLSAATFRSPIVQNAEWMEAATALHHLMDTFKQCGLDDVASAHAFRMVRSLIRGFVVNEMSGSFFASADCDESFDLAVDVFIEGLPALQRNRGSAVSPGFPG